MTVTQYKGSRYVPLFPEPEKREWSKDYQYEPLTVVLHNGNSYTSVQAVPTGIDITDENFWAETGNYNAQVESYRREVIELNQQIKDIENEFTTKTTQTMVSIPLWPELSSHSLIDNEVNNAKLAGISEVIVCVQINDYNIENIKYCVQAIENAGLSVYAIKFHNIVDDYVSVVDGIMSQCTNVKKVFVYNEMYDNNYSSVIRSLKNLNYTVGVAFNKDSYISARNNDEHDLPDIIGINIYPSAGYSLNPNREIIKSAFKDEQWFHTNKPVIITETGILPYACFYYAPELYSLSNGYPFNSTEGRAKDFNVMKNYYAAAIESLNGSCDGVCLWYWEQSNEDVARFLKGVQ